MSGCQARLSSRGRWDWQTRYCGKPVVGDDNGTPVCKYHLTMAQKRAAKYGEREQRERVAKDLAQRLSDGLGIKVRVYRDHRFEITDDVVVSAEELVRVMEAIRG